MKYKAITPMILSCLTAMHSNAGGHSIDWSMYAEEAIRIFKQHGGCVDGAQYTEFDYDNDGQEELVIYNLRSEEDRHICIFCFNDEHGFQFVDDIAFPRFHYSTDGNGAYSFRDKGEQGEYILLVNSTARMDDPGKYGDGDNLCLRFHARRDLNRHLTWGKPVSHLINRTFDMTPYDGEVSVTNCNLYWYRNTPKVMDGTGIVSFFNAICDAINMPILQKARKAVNGEHIDSFTTTIDPANGYIRVTSPDEDDTSPTLNEIECALWKRKDGRHIIALNYSIGYLDYIQWGMYKNLLFWEYDAATSSLVPIKDPMDNMWIIPNLNYSISIELPRKGKDINVTDYELGEQYKLVYQEDPDLITFYSNAFSEYTHLPCQKGLVCSIYDTSGTATNIRNAPKGKPTSYSGKYSTHNLVIGEQKDGYYRIIDDMMEDWDDDCDNVQYMYGSNTGYWIHYSCLAVKSRHNDGAPLKLLKGWDDCDKQPVTYTITKETILRPLKFAVREGWVKVQTLDGKHQGWVRKNQVAPCVRK